ncbi:MAG: RNA methyltransferase [Lewinellaceae bacterium]|nr:RNA methyltransferase [Phaeodactylibacter sp.]MCB0613560.1 RNA methyltransferase [Phaeodactylibacter sp.]MCB9349053.1 RNA methyltransferase [Lewinellaceae bacterium]
MTPERMQRLKEVASRRQAGLTVILENVHDPHNIGAVIRSCDSVGIPEIFVLYTEPHLTEDHILIGRKSASGARKWVDVHYYTSLEACFRHVKEKYRRVLATHLGESAVSLHSLDLTQPTALLFGNERDGVSEAALAYAEGNFIIPQMGMAKSLNISVACAVTLYEALRQRQHAGMYEDENPMPATEQQALYEEYLERSDQKHKNRRARRIDTGE